jgi:hypothetical protein
VTAALAETIGSAIVKGRPVFIDAGEVRVPNMNDSVRHDPDFLEFYRTFGNYLSNLLLNDGTWPSWISPALLKLVFDEPLDWTIDLRLVFGPSVESEDKVALLQSLNVDGVDGPLGEASNSVGYNHYELFETEAEPELHELEIMWKERLLDCWKNKNVNSVVYKIKEGMKDASPHIFNIKINYAEVDNALNRRPESFDDWTEYRVFSHNDNWDEEAIYLPIENLKRSMDKYVEALHVDDLRRLWIYICGNDRMTHNGSIRVVIDMSCDLIPTSSTCFNQLALYFQRYFIVEAGVVTLKFRTEEDRLTSTDLQEYASVLDKYVSDDMNTALAHGATIFTGDRIH